MKTIDYNMSNMGNIDSFCNQKTANSVAVLESSNLMQSFGLSSAYNYSKPYNFVNSFNSCFVYNQKAVEVGGIEPPDFWMTSQSLRQAIPTAFSLYYKFIIFAFLVFAGCFGVFAMAKAATYELSGTLVSKNVLDGQYVNSIDYFGYNVDIPANTTVKVQFSRTRSSWYSSAGVQDAWDTLSDGDHLATESAISLSSLSWEDPYFYYKISFETTDTSATPTLYEARVHFDEGSAPADSYETSATLISKNILDGVDPENIINTFYYNLSSLPNGTSARVQFSQDGSIWYNSSGSADGWDNLSAGENSIDLNGLVWPGGNFYYKIEMTSDGTATPVLDEIRVYYAPPPTAKATIKGGSVIIKGSQLKIK